MIASGGNSRNACSTTDHSVRSPSVTVMVLPVTSRHVPTRVARSGAMTVSDPLPASA